MNSINLNNQPLSLDYTLRCGQAFRWQLSDDGIWYGVVKDKLIELRQEENILYWKTYPVDDQALVIDYLRLNDDIKLIYDFLLNKDKNLANLIQKYYGLRILRQDPSETLFSFICSAASSIPRISASISELCNMLGEVVCYKKEVCYRAFPTTQAIAEADVDRLRAIKTLAFRGRNIQSAALQVLEKGEGWLESLRVMSFDRAREQLISIKGIGEKMADCVCLFSLNKDESVPVDTHIRQIAVRLFLPDFKCKSVTPSAYKSIREAFSERYDKYAGWAQQFLFLEDL